MRNRNHPFFRLDPTSQDLHHAHGGLIYLLITGWELTRNDNSLCFKMHQASQGLHPCNIAFGFVVCGLGADVKQKPPVIQDLSNQPGHASCNMAFNYVTCNLEAGMGRKFPFYIYNKPGLASLQHGCCLCRLRIGS